MRTFVFAYDRFDSMTTSAMLEREGIEHTVLAHTEEAAGLFAAAGTARPERIAVTGQPKGLANNRNAALDMMRDGEWALFLVDDLTRVTEIADYRQRSARPALGITMANQAQLRGSMRQPITMARFLERARELAAACDLLGARLGGFCGIDNPVFRDRHWRFNVVADGRAWVVRKSRLRFDAGAQMIDDVAWCAQNIAAYGVVAVNQWVLPDARRYSAGGFGSIDARLDQKRAEALHLVSAYPHLIRYAEKAGWPPGTHVTLRRSLPRPAADRFQALAMAAPVGA